MADSPPPGFYRADGLQGRLGTPTPGSAVGFNTSGYAYQGFIEEMPDSPRIEFGEQATFVHTYKMDANNAILIANSYFRGAITIDQSGLLYCVLSVNFNRQKGDFYEVVITAECISLNVPPDEFNVSPVEFNPSVFYNPMYSTVINYQPTADQIAAGARVGSDLINLINNAVGLQQILTRQENYGQINSSTIPDPAVLALALKLVRVLQKGAETFYLAGWKVSWSQYSYLPPKLNPGGYIEDPVLEGGLPSIFWSSDASGSLTSNILTAYSALVNPTFYEDGFSWLRQADDLDLQRTWMRVTHSWIGGPLGRWQSELYPPKVTT